MSRTKFCAAEESFTTETLGSLSDTANASVVSKVDSIDESAATHVDEETVVTQEISTKDRVRDISDIELPTKRICAEF